MGKFLRSFRGVGLGLLLFVFAAYVAIVATSRSEAGSNKGLIVADAPEGAPQYTIVDIGVVQSGDTASQGFGVSTGGVAVGRSFRTGGTQAFSWTSGGGLVGLPNLAGRTFAVSNAANDSG
ncbi:MAG: hypothetical protein ABL959_15400, partial [Pyrinomonadaceae bacterium]